jgi:hypothetical protein
MKNEARPVVFTVDASLAADLERAVGAYRNKSLVTTAASARQVTLVRGDATLVFDRASAGEGGAAAPSWSHTGAESPVAPDQIAEFVSRPQTLRAESWEARAPAGAEEVATITVVSEGEVTEVVRLVKSGESVFALRADEPGAARLAASSVDDLFGVLDAPDD